MVQAKGLQTEYMRATSTKEGATGSERDSSSKNEISKLISDKHKLQELLDQAQVGAEGMSLMDSVSIR